MTTQLHVKIINNRAKESMTFSTDLGFILHYITLTFYYIIKDTFR